MIGIGINEYLVIGKDSKVNEEKGWLTLQIKTVSLSEQRKMELAFEGKDIQEASITQNIFHPEIDARDRNGNKIGRKSPSALLTDVQNHMKYLHNFLKVYMTTSEIEAEFSLGLINKLAGITTVDELSTYFKSDKQVVTLYSKLYKEFLNVLSKHNGIDPTDEKYSFRLKLWRQKATNTYSTFPTGFNAWIESMLANPANVVVTAYDTTPFKKPAGTTIHRMSIEAPASDVVPQVEVEQATSLFTPDTSINDIFITPDADKIDE